jgi:hypothetical protein
MHEKKAKKKKRKEKKKKRKQSINSQLLLTINGLTFYLLSILRTTHHDPISLFNNLRRLRNHTTWPVWA